MNKKVLRILGILSIPAMYLAFFIATKYISFVHFSYDLLFFATIGIAYVSLHFFLDIRKMYDWIFRFRYLIGAIIFAILVIGGYHGSSISFWNNYIDKEVKIENDTPIIGIARGIRSDEWLVGTPANLSQTSKFVNFSKTNTLMNAKDNNVTFYPRLIVKDIGILMHPNHIGFLFLPIENAFSFLWYFDIFVAFFISIELFMIITKGNKLYSTLGAFLLVMAPPIFWWNTCSYIMYGGAALLIINKFLNVKKIYLRVILAALLGWVAACYVTIMYPAWMIPYAFLFVILFIWLLIENKNKIKWRDLLYLIITALICGGLVLPQYINSKEVVETISNTVYPGARTWYGGGNWRLLFTYISDMFYPYIKIDNPCEYCQYLSLFPIPIFMGIYYLIKNKREHKKIDWFLLLTSTFAILLTIWCIFPLPEFISKITLLTMSTGDRAQLVVGYTCIFMMIYMLSKYEKDNRKNEKLIDKSIYGLIATLICLICLWLSFEVINSTFSNCISTKMNIISLIIFIPIFYFLLRNKKNTNFILFLLLMSVTLFSSVLIQPITKGLNVMFEKPFAKEIQTIVKEDKNAKFLTVDGGIIVQNYILANGAKSINSTNYVPNLELWHKLDLNKKYNEIYNRYAHVQVKLIDEDTSFELVQSDAIRLNLNYNDICVTDANYLVSTIVLDEHPEYYEKIYNKNGMYIYKTTCD